MTLIRIYLVALLAFALDRLSKVWIVEWLDLKSILYIEVFDPYLNFAMGWNRGINFGLFANHADAARWILIALAIGICGWLTFWGRKQVGVLLNVGTGLVIGGALGNVWDRVQYGAVADYLNMSCCGLHNPYTFNVADVFIFAGAALLIILTGREKDSA